MIDIKHFMDIQNLIETESDLKASNAKGFEVGDIIQITEKWDGSNASVGYDPDSDSLIAFSRKQTLAYNNTLNGFWDFVQTLDPAPFKAHPTWRVFGEWGNKNKIIYKPENYKKWYIYDIYDLENGWLDQETVKSFAEEAGLIYIHVLYEGPFVSWDHCRTFMNSPIYGDRQEGVVVKNQSKLNDPNTRLPFYLKIVNEDFKETKAPKVVDPAVEAGRKAAADLAATIVTKNRIEKMLYKLRDEQILPEQLTPQDMKLVAQNLPKRIYEDCVKEEPEIVAKVNEYEGANFSKICGTLTMQIVRELICN